jgi:hypothetical protein
VNVNFEIRPKTRPRIECPDGFSISVQAREGAYCEPSENYAESYTKVECGFPSSSDISEDLKKYAESDDFQNTVYAYVPISVIVAELKRHGLDFSYCRLTTV